jgi:hypothetical protein
MLYFHGCRSSRKSKGDINALGRTSLLPILKRLSLGHFNIGNNVYTPSEH